MRQPSRSLVQVLSLAAWLAGCAAETEVPSVGGSDQPLRIVLDEAATPPFQEGRIFGVSGRVEGPARTVQVGDREIRLGEDGRFSYTEAVAPGAHRVRIRASAGDEEAGSYAAAIVGDFRAAGERVPEAAALELGNEALATLGQGAADLIARQDLDAALAARNPVITGTWGSVSITSVEHGLVEVSLRTEGGALVVAATVHELRIALAASTSSLGEHTGSLGSSATRLEAPLTIAMQGGQPSVAMGESSIALEGFTFELDALPSSLEDNTLVRDAVRAKLEEMLQEKLAELVPGYLQTALASLPASGQLDVAGIALGYDARIASLAVTPAGLSASVDLGVRAANPLPDRDHGTLALEHGAAPMTGTPGVGLSVSVDALNEAAMAAWAAGRMEIDLPRVPLGETELSTSALSLISGRLSRRVAPDQPIAAHVSVALPPVATIREDGALQLALADVPLELLAVHEDGTTEHLLTVSIGVSVAVTTTVAEGAITPELGDLSIQIDGVDARPNEVDSLEQLVRGLLLPRLSGLLDFEALRLPALRGFQIEAEQLRTQNGYVRFVGSLSYRSE